MCCKLFDRLGGKRRRLCKRRKAEFSTVLVGDTTQSHWRVPGQSTVAHTLEVLKDLLSDEQNTLFPRTLYLGEAWSVEDGWNSLNDGEFRKIINEYGDRITSKVQQVHHSLSMGDFAKAEDWSNAILSKDQDATAALLVSILPRLQVLNIYQPEQNNMLSRLGEIFQMCTVASFSGIASSRAFGSLTELNIEQGQQLNGNWIFGILAKSMLIPSLRLLRARLTEAEHCPSAYQDRSSNVVGMELEACRVDSFSIFECLRGVHRLQGFSYSFEPRYHVNRMCMEPRGIVTALRQYAWKTLVHLTLITLRPEIRDDFANGEPFIGSLRSFEALETVGLDSVMLFQEVQEPKNLSGTNDEQSKGSSLRDADVSEANDLVEMQRLVDFLPASAQRLEVAGGLSIEDVAEMFADLVELKEERLPNLCEVNFTDNDPLDQETIAICRKAGLKVRAWKRALSPWHGVYSTIRPA